MKTDIKYLKELITLLTDNGLTEISISEGDDGVTIRKETAGTVKYAAETPQVQTVEAAESPKAEAEQRKSITAPMVGTFYSSADSTTPLAEVGQTIKQGDVVCVIEAMKLMNEIESDVSGKIVEICVKDGDPVEYGQVLMYLE